MHDTLRPSLTLPARSARHRRAAALVALALVLTTAVSCTKDDAASSAATCDSSASPKWPKGAGSKEGAPTIKAPCGKAPTKLVVTDLKPGKGEAVKKGTLVSVDYIGALYENGKVFDASYGRAPFPLTLGAGSVIKGWDQGLVGMKVGGRRQLVIPADLAYGEQANGDIPANATLIFVVDLRSATTPPPVPGAVPGGTVDELQITDQITGTGAEVKDGATVSVQYIGVHGATGELIESSWDRGTPVNVLIGGGQVMKGWDQGLLGMKVGGRRLLEIPASLAYGAEGRPPQIQPNETLVFVVDLVGIS